jgi:hypothetical protein
MGYRAKRPYDTDFDRDDWRKTVPALNPKSTLFKKLADQLKTTALFDVPR